MLFRQALERDLQQTQNVCMKLQTQGMYPEALKYLERCLTLTSELHGPESGLAWEARKNVADLCNMLAMNALNTGEMEQCYTLLTRAEQLTAGKVGAPQADRLRLRAVTLNNLGCYYKKKGRLRSALKCLGKALKIESRLKDVKNPADTHLNICACQSQLGRHAEALEHSQAALILLQDELFSSASGGQSDVAPPKERVAVMAIAYHNIAVEQEYLKKYELAIQSYRKALEIAEKHLGPDQGITAVLQDVTTKARQENILRTRLKKRSQNTTGKKSSSWASQAKPRGMESPGLEEEQGVADMVAGDMKMRETLNSIAPSNPATGLAGPGRPMRSKTSMDMHEMHEDLHAGMGGGMGASAPRSFSAMDDYGELPDIHGEY